MMHTCHIVNNAITLIAVVINNRRCQWLPNEVTWLKMVSSMKRCWRDSNLWSDVDVVLFMSTWPWPVNHSFILLFIREIIFNHNYCFMIMIQYVGGFLYVICINIIITIYTLNIITVSCKSKFTGMWTNSGEGYLTAEIMPSWIVPIYR